MNGMANEPRELKAFAPALALLVILAVINYIDRANLSIAAPLLQNELHISVAQIGILLSAFFWTYTALQFICGWIVDRFDASRVIAAGYLLWSIATAATGLVQGFTMLLTMRLLLGVGESVTFPALSKILSLHLPGASPGLRQWPPARSHKVWSSSRHFGVRFPHNAVRLAACVHRNRPDQSGLASSMEAVDASPENRQ